MADVFSRYRFTVELDTFLPDWNESYSGTAEMEASLLADIKFTGPGWYLTKTDTVLIIVVGLTDNPWKGNVSPTAQLRAFVWNRTDIGDMFNAIVNAPTRSDTSR